MIKWTISLFTLILTKQYLLRAFDYLMTQDFTGIAVVIIAIVEQVSDIFLKDNLVNFSDIITNPEKFCQRLDYK